MLFLIFSYALLHLWINVGAICNFGHISGDQWDGGERRDRARLAKLKLSEFTIPFPMIPIATGSCTGWFCIIFN